MLRVMVVRVEEEKCGCECCSFNARCYLLTQSNTPPRLVKSTPGANPESPLSSPLAKGVILTSNPDHLNGHPRKSPKAATQPNPSLIILAFPTWICLDLPSRGVRTSPAAATSTHPPFKDRPKPLEPAIPQIPHSTSLE
ncbi:MAG: hypothetical protein JWR69_814 [Pedosphaera sp.]|nr:hypothetical protein [Pedosphaera sp.]